MASRIGRDKGVVAIVAVTAVAGAFLVEQPMLWLMAVAAALVLWFVRRWLLGRYIAGEMSFVAVFVLRFGFTVGVLALGCALVALASR